MLLHLLYVFACSPLEPPEREAPIAIDRSLILEDESAVQVKILSPVSGETVDNPVTFTVRHVGVSELALNADGWSLGSAWENGQLTYEFLEVDRPRVITLEGLNEDGHVVASDTITLTATNGGTTTDVPYYYQYNNTYEPRSTCGITSAAMLLGSRGIDRTPDSLYRKYGKSQGQSPEGLAALYRWEGLRVDSGRAGTRDDLRALLDAGDPVVVHGFWTSSGHIVVIVGYDSEGWIVNDPGGDWYLGYGNGSGEAVRYPYRSDWDAGLSWDGDIWWSTGW